MLILQRKTTQPATAKNWPKQRLHVEMCGLESLSELRGMPDTKSTPKRAFLLLFIAKCPLL